MAAENFFRHPGAAEPPSDDPMRDGVGAASWAKDRADRCDLNLAGEPKIQPMSILDGWHVDSNDIDPHGLTVHGADGVAAGTVTDLWVDRSEPAIRYLQVELPGGTHVLAPMGFCRVGKTGVKVQALHAKHFAAIPRPKATDRITLLEEDKVVAWFAGGYRYASPERNEPLI